MKRSQFLCKMMENCGDIIMKKYIVLLCVILFGSIAFASDYNVYKLDNGQTVIVKQITSNPIVIIDTWIKTGSINENDKNMLTKRKFKRFRKDECLNLKIIIIFLQSIYII